MGASVAPCGDAAAAQAQVLAVNVSAAHAAAVSSLTRFIMAWVSPCWVFVSSFLRNAKELQ
jgi:hypothetical protein